LSIHDAVDDDLLQDLVGIYEDHVWRDTAEQCANRRPVFSGREDHHALVTLQALRNEVCNGMAQDVVAIEEGDTMLGSSREGSHEAQMIIAPISRPN
jgi:hypothetical protein